MGQLVPILELGIGHGLSVPSGFKAMGNNTSWEQEELLQSKFVKYFFSFLFLCTHWFSCNFFFFN
jgi:hypothetical protein